MDLTLLREAIAIARLAREHGNHPFGALLADAQGNILLRVENTVLTERDPTGHAETNLVRLAARQFPPEDLAAATLYTSTEPCPMCAGAIYWSGIGRVAYALGQERFYALLGQADLHLPCRQVLGHGARTVEVTGPALEDEAIRVHEGFWV